MAQLIPTYVTIIRSTARDSVSQRRDNRDSPSSGIIFPLDELPERCAEVMLCMYYFSYSF